MSDGRRSCLGPIVLVLCVAGLGYFLFSRGYLVRKSDVNRRLEQASAEINKSTPKLIDEYTRLESTNLGADRTLAFNLTIINFNGQTRPPNAVSVLRNRNLVLYRTNPQMKVLRDMGVTVRFRYSNQFGVPSWIFLWVPMISDFGFVLFFPLRTCQPLPIRTARSRPPRHRPYECGSWKR